MNEIIPKFYHTENGTLSSLEEEECKKAVESQDAQRIRELFFKKLLPLDLETQFAIITFMQKKTTKTCMQLLLENNTLSTHTICFDIADAILKKGASLPTPYFDKEKYSKTSEYFAHLVSGCHDLFIALRSTPDIIKERDEHNQTLLHHSASIGCCVGKNSASLIFYLLFLSPDIDCTAKDNSNSTPLEIAEAIQEKTTITYICPLLREKTEQAHK